MLVKLIQNRNGAWCPGEADASYCAVGVPLATQLQRDLCSHLSFYRAVLNL